MDTRLKWIYRLILVLLLFILLFFLMHLKPMWAPMLHLLAKIVLPFFVAGFISYLLHPLVEYLHENGLGRAWSILIIYLLFFGGAGYGIYRGIPAIIDQIGELSESAPMVAERYRDWMVLIERKTDHWPFGVHDRIDELIRLLETKISAAMGTVMEYLLRTFDFILLIALIPFIVFYFLKDYPALKKMVWYLTPRRWRKKGIAFLQDVDVSLGGYIRGQVFVCVLIGICSAALFWIVGMPYPLLLGVIIGITNIIPYFGPVIGAVPAVAIAASLSLKMVLIVAGIVLLLQFLEGNILSPLIVGKSLHMHPVFIMFALLAGGEIAGLPGMIFAVPLLAVFKVFLLHARSHFGKQASPYPDSGGEGN